LASPANHAHRLALVSAARAAADGATHDAIEAFDRAIALAREHGFGHHEALANELCGELHLDEGRGKVARVYLVDAYRGYRAWGARTKVAELAARHPDLLADAATPETLAPSTVMTSPTSAFGLDVASAMRMMQAIAGELVLDKLIERLMSCLVENAAAQRGFLIVPREGRLQVSAALSVQPDLVRLGLAQDLESTRELPAAVVHYVARSRAPVVLADAVIDDRFAGDPYVVAARPRSVLCVPCTSRTTPPRASSIPAGSS
jgi:GAF domain-containing protein